MSPQQPVELPPPRIEVRANDQQQQTREHLFADFFQTMRERREERRQHRMERRYGAAEQPHGDAPGDHSVLHDQGGLKELRLPRGFHKADDKHVQPNWNETRSVYEMKGAPNTRICYSRDNGWLPSAEAQAALKDVLSKPSHKLSEDEVDAISEIIPKPPYGTRGPFSVTSLSTREIDGKQVLEMELKNDMGDRHAYGYFFNPNYAKPPEGFPAQTKTGSLECVWFEAPGDAYRRNQQVVLDALRSAKLK